VRPLHRGRYSARAVFLLHLFRDTARWSCALFIFERPSMPSRCASLYSCSRVLPPFDELVREVDPEREPEERELEPEELDRERDDDFVSPDCARCLFTVLAAISVARFVERPCFRSLSLMCSYCRSRLLLHAFGIRVSPLQ
jgi:hypothetical protein